MQIEKCVFIYQLLKKKKSTFTLTANDQVHNDVIKASCQNRFTACQVSSYNDHNYILSPAGSFEASDLCVEEMNHGGEPNRCGARVVWSEKAWVERDLRLGCQWRLWQQNLQLLLVAHTCSTSMSWPYIESSTIGPPRYLYRVGLFGKLNCDLNAQTMSKAMF